MNEKVHLAARLVGAVADGLLDVVAREGDREVLLSVIAADLHGVAADIEEVFGRP